MDGGLADYRFDLPALIPRSTATGYSAARQDPDDWWSTGVLVRTEVPSVGVRLRSSVVLELVALRRY